MRSFIFEDGPRLLKHMWLQPEGDYSDSNGFFWLWRFWTWFDLNADYGHPSWVGAAVDGFRMAWDSRACARSSVDPERTTMRIAEWTALGGDTVRLARSRDGRVIHRSGCRYAAVPWLWAETATEDELLSAKLRMGYKVCKKCAPSLGSEL